MVSQKGGVGKSTLCQLIARRPPRKAKQAKIRDFDVKQMSSVDWVRARMEHVLVPEVEAEPNKDVRKAMKLNRDYDVIVLDGAPGTPKRTAEMVRGKRPHHPADRRPSRADLVPMLALARRLSQMKHNAAGPFSRRCAGY